jgi:hypothetical protein
MKESRLIAQVSLPRISEKSVKNWDATGRRYQQQAAATAGDAMGSSPEARAYCVVQLAHGTYTPMLAPAPAIRTSPSRIAHPRRPQATARVFPFFLRDQRLVPLLSLFSFFFFEA